MSVKWDREVAASVINVGLIATTTYTSFSLTYRALDYIFGPAVNKLRLDCQCPRCGKECTHCVAILTLEGKGKASGNISAKKAS